MAKRKPSNNAVVFRFEFLAQGKKPMWLPQELFAGYIAAHQALTGKEVSAPRMRFYGVPALTMKTTKKAKEAMSDEFSEGQRACDQGKPRSANPYTEGSESFVYWDRGWKVLHDAYMLDLKERKERQQK